MFMECLPVEVLEAVLSYLPLHDQKSLALTCRKLYALVTTPCFLLKRHFILREPLEKTKFLFTEPNRVTGFYSYGFRPQAAEHLPAVSTDPSGVYHWALFVRRLSFSHGAINPKLFIDLLSNCVNLESLDLSGHSLLFDTDVFTGNKLDCFTDPERRRRVLETAGKSLRKLSLAHVSLTDKSFRLIFDLFPLLDDLDISGCNMDFSDFTPDRHQYSEFFPPSLSFMTVLHVFKSRYSGAECVQQPIVLRLNSTEINDSALTTMGCTLQFRGIFLDNCRNLTDQGICTFIESQAPFNCLKEVSIGHPGPDVSGLTWTTIVGKLGNELSLLRLSKWPHLTQSFRCSIEPLQCIQHLDFSLSSSMFNSSKINWRNFSLLTTLNFSGHTHLTDSDASAFIVGLQNQLKYLDISCCTRLSDKTLSQLSSYQRESLEVLLANWCSGFTDTGILGHETADGNHLGGLHFLRRLKHLNLSDCRRITGMAFSHPTLSHEFSRNLRCLKLARVSVVHGEIVEIIACSYPVIEVLDIARSDIDDRTIENVSAKLSHHLRELNVSGCENLTDKALCYLSSNLPFLRALDVSFCPNITQDGIKAFVQVMPYLSDFKFLYAGAAVPDCFFVNRLLC